MCCVSVFASSLLSLISPWAGSRGAPCRRWRAPPRPPRAPRTPWVPPPPLRRHSLPPTRSPHSSITPHSPHEARTTHRRYSDIRNPPVSKLDLRQELLSLNLGTQEFDSWLGQKFEENEEYENEPYYDRFKHDISLQRSISLDRGVEIFNHLQTIGSESSGSVGSVWTVDSDGRDSFTVDRYRSFEDIPTSPYKVRSRRASFGVQTFSERNIALAVLNESYKGLEANRRSVSPQIRKLQRCFTFSGTFDSIKDKSLADNLEVEKDRPKLKLVVPNRRDSLSCPVSPEIRRLKNFSFRNSADDVGTKMSDDEDQGFEVQEPFYRSISVEWNQGEEPKVRQRRSGLQAMKEDLRKAVLVKQEFKSCENLFGRNRGLPEVAELTSKSLLKGSYVERNSNLKLKKNISFSGNTDSKKVVPTIIISHSDSYTSGVAKISNTSNYVEISRNCDCRICSEGDRGCFIRNVLSKLFVKIVSCTYSRKCYWDENNNLNDSEMYKCIMHVLKLMLGLWLRHLDHKVE